MIRGRLFRLAIGLIHLLVHRGIGRYTFVEHGCFVCRYMFRRFIPPGALEFPDQSSIDILPTEVDDEGRLVRRGVTMTATAQRQFDALDAEGRAALERVIEKLRDPRTPRP